MSNANHQTDYVICLYDQGDALSVLKGEVYKVVTPEANDPDAMIRIIDEEGEDYLYPRDWFVAIDLPQAAIDALEAA
jgi:hypothetical protein